MEFNTFYNKIQTDESMMETIQHGNSEYPFQLYYDDLALFDFHCVEWHWHVEFEFVFVQEGTATFWVGEKQFSLGQGTGIFINLKILHRYFSEGHAIVPNFVLKPTFLAPADSLIYKKYIAPIQACKVDCIVFCREIKWQAEALELMQKILKAQESDKDRELVTLFLTQELWHLLYLHMDSEVLQKKRENTASSQGRTQLMMQYIHQNFRQNLTLEDIAGQAMVSKSTALNLFRRYLHDTPVHYLVKYRLQEAAKLLATTEKKITVISGETGFENMDYFCKTFKKYYGRTPTEYRRKKQMDTDDREWIVQDVV